jgi:hypothetical protein
MQYSPNISAKNEQFLTIIDKTYALLLNDLELLAIKKAASI